VTYEAVPRVRMNQCPSCVALPGERCRNPRGEHQERVEIAHFVELVMAKRRYIDHMTTSYGALVCSPECEHCDGEKSRWVRADSLRGWICPICDDALDAMLAEPDDEPKELVP
jgi:hypothetical protein